MGLFEGPRWRLPLQRTFFICVAFGLTVGSLAPPSFGQSSGQIVAGNTYAVVGVGDSDVLNIRSEPNPSASAAGSIPPKGRSIVASGAVVRQGSALWAQVYYKDVVGWVNSRYLAEDDSRPRNITDLYKLGISVKFIDATVERAKGFAGSTPEHPNKCPYAIAPYSEDNAYRLKRDIEISISNEMLAHFVTRGFSLKTLCLAMTTPMTYNLETGVPMPSVDLGYRHWVLLNVPDCFRRGAPLLDCRLNYHWFWRDRLDRAATAAKLDRLMKQKFQARAALPRVLNKENFEKFAGTGLAEELFASGPAVLVRFIEISPDFELGYAYRLDTGFTAGDDPEEERRKEGSSGRQMLTKADMKVALPWGQ